MCVIRRLQSVVVSRVGRSSSEGTKCWAKGFKAAGTGITTHRRKVNDELPERLSARTSIHVPERVVDGTGGDVDNPLLRANPIHGTCLVQSVE